MFSNMAQLENHIYKEKLEELCKSLDTLAEEADYTSPSLRINKSDRHTRQ